MAQPVAPQPAATDNHLLAAGYKALTLCSAMFNARWMSGVRSRSSVDTNELQGIYPELEPLMAEMSPVIATNHVLVRNGDGSVRALAYWRVAGDGCAVGRPGMSLGEAMGHLGFRPQRRPQLPPAAWPLGDEDAFSPVGMDADVAFLDATIHGALDGVYGARTNTTALVIVHNGRIVRERYADGFGIHTPQRTWSVAKSIAATIVGAAVQRGEVDVTAPAAIANWQHEGDPRRAITLDHLLHMASGLTSDSAGNRTDGIYFGGVAVDEQAPGWPLIAQPGSTFRYANNDTLLATLAIAPTFATHPPRAFFDSINMHSTIAETDWRGNYVLSSQVWATARDLARFGMLYLYDGMWNGTRILPENWRTYVSTPSGPQPPGDFGYGASFWLMNRSEGVPADTIAAFGNRGQYVVIVPSRNIVIVRRGEDPAGTRFDIAGFTRDVLAALE